MGTTYQPTAAAVASRIADTPRIRQRVEIPSWVSTPVTEFRLPRLGSDAPAPRAPTVRRPKEQSKPSVLMRIARTISELTATPPESRSRVRKSASPEAPKVEPTVSTSTVQRPKRSWD